jgi:hypothetical protein
MSYELKYYIVAFRKGKNKIKYWPVLAEDVEEAKYSIQLGWPEHEIIGVFVETWSNEMEEI